MSQQAACEILCGGSSGGGRGGGLRGRSTWGLGDPTFGDRRWGRPGYDRWGNLPPEDSEGSFVGFGDGKFWGRPRPIVDTWGRGKGKGKGPYDRHWSAQSTGSATYYNNISPRK